jgi:hypothetical protein
LQAPFFVPNTTIAIFDLDGNRIAEYNAETGALLAEYVWLNGRPIAVISGGVANTGAGAFAS